MDKNTWIGFALIAAIIIGFSLLNRPSKEELERRQHYQDSVRYARQLEIETQEALRKAEAEMATLPADEKQNSSSLQEVFGAFAPSAVGTEGETVLENQLVKLYLATKGGNIVKAELKNYKS